MRNQDPTSTTSARTWPEIAAGSTALLAGGGAIGFAVISTHHAGLSEAAVIAGVGVGLVALGIAAIGHWIRRA